MSALLSELFQYAALSVLAMLGLYIALRVGTLAVLQSISQFRRRRQMEGN